MPNGIGPRQIGGPGITQQDLLSQVQDAIQANLNLGGVAPRPFTFNRFPGGGGRGGGRSSLQSVIPEVGDRGPGAAAGPGRQGDCDPCGQQFSVTRHLQARKFEVELNPGSEVRIIGGNSRRVAIWFYNQPSGQLDLAWQSFALCSVPDYTLDESETLRLLWEDWGPVVQSEWFAGDPGIFKVVAITEVWCK